MLSYFDAAVDQPIHNERTKLIRSSDAAMVRVCYELFAELAKSNISKVSRYTLIKSKVTFRVLPSMRTDV